MRRVLIERASTLIAHRLAILRRVLRLLQLLTLLRIRHRFSYLNAVRVRVCRRMIEEVRTNSTVRLRAQVVCHGVNVLSVLTVRRRLRQNVLRTRVPINEFGTTCISYHVRACYTARGRW